jgi:hypothetical protein
VNVSERSGHRAMRVEAGKRGGLRRSMPNQEQSFNLGNLVDE